ncbi:unnamed protein product [Euphydryas editha]|uniref:Carboxylic ester hydrolase n=1 Tax=Euphydryas editha TaxID=104508 RepID=A0AAU9TCX9_EUPED|nr:unnamed protein product [Euphydryas editha]
MFWTIFVIILFDYVKGDLDLTVATTQGGIKGFRDGENTIYLGIPYATVNRDNPFGIAQPYRKFHLLYEAFEDPPACPQMLNGEAIGDLDCLRLNIFAPNKASVRNKLPVIVWLYGGAFSTGYTKRYKFGAGKLIKRDVIVVTLNYRLGPYGFMCLDTPQIPGNQGIKDQLIAMKWVKNNIKFFGGDVDKITLMGESAGAASVEAHLLSKQEKLYNQVILQSGTMLKPGNIMESNVDAPLKISEELGFKTDNITKALEFLTNSDPKTVILATSKLSINLKVCIEKKFNNVENILTDRPYNLEIPKIKDMKVLAGFNSREGLVMNARNPSEYINNTNFFRDALTNIFEYDKEFETMVNIVRNFYIGDAELNEKVRNDIIEFQSDFFYNFPLQWCLDRFLDNGAGNIYQYMFSYEGSLNYIKNVLNISLDGACHGDELGYLFDMNEDETPSVEDQKVIDRITTLWTNFAKYGNPTPVKTDLLPVTWQPISEDTVPYLNIGSDVTMWSRPFKRRLTFWKLFLIANQRRLKGFRHE